MITINFSSKKFIPNNIYHYIKNFLIQNKIGQKTETNHPDIGHYTNAEKIGWGFHNSLTTKTYLHNIFKNQSFYPKTIIINKKWTKNNKDKIEQFMNNETMVVKYDKGYQGKNVFLVNSYNDILNKIDKNYWVLQKIIKPKLFGTRKFDMRIYHFIFRYKNDYYNILSKVGFSKVSIHNYTDKTEKGFITNIIFNNIDKQNNNIRNMYEIFEFMHLLEPNPNKREDLINKIYDLIREYSKLLCQDIRSHNNNKSTAQIMIYGPDIIFDENNNALLIETNGYPGFLIKGEEIYNKQRDLINELLNNILIPILQNKDINLNNYKGNMFIIEKL